MKRYEIEVVNSDDPFGMPDIFYLSASSNSEARKQARKRVKGQGRITGVRVVGCSMKTFF